MPISLGFCTCICLAGEFQRHNLSHGSDILLIILPSVYVDLDTDCLRPTSTAFDAFSITTSENATASADAEQVNQFAVFGRMGTDESFENSISNAWMASSPGHPFSHAPTVCANPDRKEQIVHILVVSQIFGGGMDRPGCPVQSYPRF